MLQQLMSRCIRRLRRKSSVCLPALFFLSLSAAHPSWARVVRVVVESRGPLHNSEAKIPYEQLQGVIYGEVDPADPHDAIIQDIGLAPRNAQGKVEYVATFTLLKPVDARQSSGILLYEVVNRGASILPKDFSTGDVFLMSGWQGDLPFRGKSVYGLPGETVQLPIARNPDGTPITGPILLRFANMPQGAASISTHAAAGYSSSGAPPLPVDTDTAHASLTSRTFETETGVAGGEVSISASDWSWGDCSETPFPGKPDPRSICLRQGFDASRLYQLVYQGKDPIVQGLGLAAMRDAASFFRYSRTDDERWENPIAGAASHAIVLGASQSGNLIRTYLNLGFNQDESGRKVFDGAMPSIAARQTPINLRFAVPGGASNLYEPGSDGTVWWNHWPDESRHHPPSGLLDRCTASHTCPVIVDLLGSSEFWSLRASPDFVGTDDARDIPLPPNVRRYYIASTQHGGGAGGFHSAPPAPTEPQGRRNPFAPPGCVLPLNPNPEREIQRALLVALKAWVVAGTLPPPSVYPSKASGELVPANAHAMGFPHVPGLPLPDAVANPLLVYDFGRAFNANDLGGAIENEPPAIVGVVEPFVPRVDRDGNEVGGIHTVLAQAPLGTYLGWNVTSRGFFKGQYCSLAGGYLPFAQTRAERDAAHDSRHSLEERYGTHRGYVCAVHSAAGKLVHQRFLLQEDAAHLIGEAESSDVLNGVKSSTQDEAVAARLCVSPNP